MIPGDTEEVTFCSWLWISKYEGNNINCVVSYGKVSDNDFLVCVKSTEVTMFITGMQPKSSVRSDPHIFITVATKTTTRKYSLRTL